jgi:hypothetical protein
LPFADGMAASAAADLPVTRSAVRHPNGLIPGISTRMPA